MAVVAALRVAPVKGLATVPRDAVQLDRAGVAEDRRVFLLDAAGAVVTLRSHPQLVRVVPDLDLAAGVLTVTLPDGTTAASALDSAGDAVTALLYGKARRGRVLDGDVPAALSAVAREPLRVVLADGIGVGWDEGPVSILSTASAEAVGGAERDRRRYRMLLELDGLRPFEEEEWVGRRIAVDEAHVRVAHPLVRCVVITHSPTTGMKDWDGLEALARRRGRDHLCLGVIAEVDQPGTVRVGAPVEVLG